MDKNGQTAKTAAPQLPRQRVKLTNRFIETRGAAAAGKREDHHDSLVPGLALRVTDRGAKSFVLHGRFPRQPTVFTRRTLGGYPGLTLEEARAKAPKPLPLGAPPPPPRPSSPRRPRGGYPGLPLEEARAKARQWQRLIERGVDPATEEEREKAAAMQAGANTFEAVAEAFLEE